MTIKDHWLPDPRDLLRSTQWTSLEHAGGPATGTGSVLLGLLADYPDAQVRALRHLYDPLHHQNTIYSATVPAARYVAASLVDPRTATLIPGKDHGLAHPLRASLLDWLGSVVTEVGNDAEATMARLGLSMAEDPGSAEIQALRPALFRPVSALLHDPDAAIQAAAVAAAVPFLDAPELLYHRAALIPLMRQLVVSEARRSYRAAAAHGFEAWGEGAGVEHLVWQPDPWGEGFSTEPPF